MAALPVDPCAFPAAPVATVGDPDPGWNRGPNRLRCSGSQAPVADDAPAEGCHLRAELKLLDQIGQLGAGRSRTEIATVGDRAAHQQLPVACQEDAVLASRQFGQGGITQIVVPEGIETQHPQPFGQGPQMGVGEKPRHPQWAWSQLQEWPYIEGLEHGIDRDALAVADGRLQTDGFAAAYDEFNLSVRDPTALDQVPDRGGRHELDHPIPLTPLRYQKVVQLGIKTQGDRGHVEIGGGVSDRFQVPTRSLMRAIRTLGRSSLSLRISQCNPETSIKSDARRYAIWRPPLPTHPPNAPAVALPHPSHPCRYAKPWNS